MRIDKLTSKLQNALADAQSLAVGRGHNEIHPQHLLLALLEDRDGGLKALVNKAGGDATSLMSGLKRQLDDLPTVSQFDGNVAPRRPSASF